MDAIARTPRRLVVIFAMTMALSSLVPCGAAAAGLEGTEPGTKVDSTMDRIAERFVKLALAVGEHDPFYVDA